MRKTYTQKYALVKNNDFRNRKLFLLDETKNKTFDKLTYLRFCEIINWPLLQSTFQFENFITIKCCITLRN